MSAGRVIFLESVGSTNAEARRLAAAGVEHGTVIVAARQTAGKGRGDHAWHSPDGGLYLSAILEVPPNGKVTDLSFVAGIALAETLEGALSGSGRRVSVKWPNDCLVDGKKIAGILGEGIEGKSQAVVGIGVNVRVEAGELAPFSNARFPATSLHLEMAAPGSTIPAIRDALLDNLFRWYQEYARCGFATIQARWERHCAFVGKPVSLAPGAGYRESGRVGEEPAEVRGTCLGIDGEGALVLSTAAGARRHYFSGELSDVVGFGHRE